MIKGAKMSAEARRNISVAATGRKLTEETRRKISMATRGEKNARWNGGRTTTSMGYCRVLSPSHPWADCYGYVLEHRLVMEAHLGRTLLPTEVVHHINGIVDDNRIENLERFDSHSAHARHHKEKRREK